MACSSLGSAITRFRLPSRVAKKYSTATSAPRKSTSTLAPPPPFTFQTPQDPAAPSPSLSPDDPFDSFPSSGVTPFRRPTFDRPGKMKKLLDRYNRCLQECARDEDWTRFEEFNQSMIGLGVTPDISTYGLRLFAFQQQHRWPAVVQTWKEMNDLKLKLRPAQLTSYILACIRHNEEKEVETTYERFLRSFQPDINFYNRCMTVCLEQSKWKDIEEWYAKARARRLVPQTYTMGVRIAAFLRQRNWKGVNKVWAEMLSLKIPADVRTFTEYVTTCISDNKTEDLKKILEGMHTAGVHGDTHFYNSCLQECSRQKKWDMFEEWVQRMKREEHAPPDTTTIIVVIRAYENQNRWEKVSEIWTQFKSGIVLLESKAYTAYAVACLKQGKEKELEDTIQEMHDKRIEFTPYFYTGMLLACIEVDKWPEFDAWTAKLVESGIQPNVATMAIRLLGYEKQTNWVGMRQVWKETKELDLQPDIRMYATYIVGCIKPGLLKEMEEIYKEMEVAGIQKTPSFFLRCLGAAADLSQWQFFGRFNQKIILWADPTMKPPYDPRWEDVKKAWKILARTVGLKMDSHLYQPYYIAYVKRRNFTLADQILAEMKETGAIPDLEFCNRAMRAFGDLGLTEKFEEWDRKVTAEGPLFPNEFTVATRLNVRAKMRQWEMVDQIWSTRSTVRPTIRVYSAYILACLRKLRECIPNKHMENPTSQTSDQKVAEKAIRDEINKTLGEMKERRVAPTTYFYNRCMDLCVEYNWTDDYLWWKEKMEEQGIRPNHITTLLHVKFTGLHEQQEAEAAAAEAAAKEAAAKEAAPKEAAPKEAAPKEAAPKEAAPKE